MSRKPIIQDADQIAQQVARIILEDSYEGRRREGTIKDVLLFGSALRREPAHDIDMLVIHDNLYLSDFGFATIYDGGMMIPDENANLQEGGYLPQALLEAMGGKGIADFEDIEYQIRRAGREQTIELRTSEGQYQGTLDLPYIGRVEFPDPVPFKTMLDAVGEKIDEELRSKMVSTKVSALMEDQGLNLNEVLDLHVMKQGLLSPGKMEYERGIVISQCADSTFWNTVLTTGRLYNSNSGKFEVPVDQKYQGASNLFPKGNTK